MAWIHVTHTVKDYEKWKPVFDSTESLKRSYGWKQSMIFGVEDSPNKLIVMEEFESKQQAKSFLDSDELRKAMDKAGVTGTPDMRILEQKAVAKPRVHG